MTYVPKSPTADCLYCGKPIRRNKLGGWFARKRSDASPFCDLSPDGYHAPLPAAELTEETLSADPLDSSQACP
jgi:hypothetical protein